jgi:hypothetical protein
MIIIPHTVVIFIQNRKKGKESKILERQRERERVCVCARGRVVARRGGVSCKNDCWRDGPFGIKIEGLF